MKMFTKEIKDRLLKNGAADAIAIAKDGDTADHKPVVKLFNPTGAGTWLLTAIDPDQPEMAFGLCDLGMGSPEMGYVYLPELEAYKGPLGIGIERDQHWTADKTLTAYAAEARATGSIRT